jgi:sulfite reductase beta subunit-like hemoprotein
MATTKQKQARSHFKKMVEKAKKERKKGEPFHKAVKRVHRKMK